MDTRIGIKDIAEKAGVSKGTVDRVLHKRGNVSSKAKEKVLAAMKELDYEPNFLASALASKTNCNIAVLLPDSKNDPFWVQPKKGINRAKKSLRDYRVMIDIYPFKDADPKDFKKQANKLLAKNYRAILISPSFSKEGHEVLDLIEAQQIPYIQFNTFLERNSKYFLAYIGQDSYASGMLAAKLLNFGLKEDTTAMILHLEKDAYNAKHLVDKETGFKDFFSEHTEKNIKVVKASFGDVSDKTKLKKFLTKTLSNHPDIEGIFVTTSKVFHIVPILKKLKRTEIKLVGFDLLQNNLKHLYAEKIHFLINQNPHKQGFFGIMNLFNYLILKKKIKPLQMLPLDVVMKENVQYYLEEKDEELHIVI